MLRRFSTIFTLSFLLVAFMAMTAFATKTAVKSRIAGKISTKTMYYSPVTDVDPVNGTASVSIGKTSTYTSNAATVSPGVVLGDTWYDYQQNGTMGRMIDWGQSATTGNAYIHTIWMSLPTFDTQTGRHYSYRLYNAANGSFGPVVNPQDGTDYAGYVQVQSNGAGAGILGGHNKKLGQFYRSHLYYNLSAGAPFFGESVVTDSVASYGTAPAILNQQVIWPKFAYQEGTDTVTHIFAQVSPQDGGTEKEGVYYFRKVGVKEAGVWDYPPYVVDTQNVLAQAVVASKTSDKVALAWLGRVPADGDCDTCSNNADVSLLWEQSENDVYYQISNDQGANWDPRVNITKYQWGAPGFRAYSELSVTFDSADNLHVIWVGRNWADSFENLILPKSGRIFHWSENVSVIRTVVNSEWEQEDSIKCTGGVFQLNVSKVQISECNGRIYVLFVQYNDFPNGVWDDCAARISDPAEYQGAGNGDLYVTISEDGGTTWDVARNLTNSRTPGCEPGVSGDCESDGWPSMTRYGRQNLVTEDWSGAQEVIPTGGSNPDDYWLDVMYLSDRDAGGFAAGGTQAEGTQQNSNLQWFRLACVEAIPSAQISLAPSKVGLPTWTKPGVELVMPLVVENSGNVPLTYSTSIVEDNGSGWLGCSFTSGSINSGLFNTAPGSIFLNAGGAQTTEAVLTGRIIWTSNAPNTVNIEVSLVVADTVVGPVTDTLAGYLSLSVRSDGSFGHYASKLNMDFVTNGVDCDTTATNYVGVGSPLILQVNGSDTTIGQSAFSTWIEDGNFRPVLGITPAKGSATGYNWYSTGSFVSPDSSVAFSQTFYAPTASGANYIIKALKVWSNDGSSHSGLRIGDVTDWDIPSDSGSDNHAGIDPLSSRNLIYQVGTEFDTDDTTGNTDCMDGDRRFGGMSFLKSTLNGADIAYELRAYTARNDSFVYPAGKLVAGRTWNNMELSGFTNLETVEPTDLHMVMCYNPSLTLNGTDTVIFYTAYVSVYDGVEGDVGTAADAAKAFAVANNYFVPSTGCCVDIRGNVDNDIDDIVDISDLVYLVDFMFTDGPAPECEAEGNVDGDIDEIIDISDLVYLVDFMFTDGPLPPTCP
jgi:hypothetical protein